MAGKSIISNRSRSITFLEAVDLDEPAPLEEPATALHPGLAPEGGLAAVVSLEELEPGLDEPDMIADGCRVGKGV